MFDKRTSSDLVSKPEQTTTVLALYEQTDFHPSYQQLETMRSSSWIKRYGIDLASHQCGFVNEDKSCTGDVEDEAVPELEDKPGIT